MLSLLILVQNCLQRLSLDKELPVARKKMKFVCMDAVINKLVHDVEFIFCYVLSKLLAKVIIIKQQDITSMRRDNPYPDPIFLS